ncbi:4-(cytidine 5'-diphospho)-2-C-methyl-D-erythritol kinase [Orenia marismortui]|uniref:4-diphosphocytidyl-2-C-methyl-D-erythritol kinase n=1 Tax=Orenia marismortui TaxID=46469 RepID=A0A4R8H8Q0_9FIRM|nr:4-(cytidine 5'-diphospho)-2-C-methyl-D-erythritol kinase [Orenia marismortui]TDX51272.1 4-diphosphocytidyl-2-C-methyl-D-erythritol kinase [Orenia marismortui]
MVDNIDLKSYAKINLTLDVLAKRKDGYHEVEMIMQTIDLSDKLSFSKIKKGIEIITDHPDVPTDNSNLIYKAAKMLFGEFGITEGIRVNLTKRIPVAAGLAGGSSNAAATLVAINQLWGLNLSKEELATRAANLGADIPFCINGGTQLATGIGTELKILDQAPEIYLVLVNPPFEVSTAEVYGNLDLHKINIHPNKDKVLEGLKDKRSDIIIKWSSNLLENVTLKRYPDVKRLKEKVDSLTSKALMSGSGPTVLGFVRGIKEANKVKNILEQELDNKHHIVVSKTNNKGIEEI